MLKRKHIEGRRSRPPGLAAIDLFGESSTFAIEAAKQIEELRRRGTAFIESRVQWHGSRNKAIDKLLESCPSEQAYRVLKYLLPKGKGAPAKPISKKATPKQMRNLRQETILTNYEICKSFDPSKKNFARWLLGCRDLKPNAEPTSADEIIASVSKDDDRIGGVLRALDRALKRRKGSGTATR